LAKDKKTICIQDLRRRILTQRIAPGSDLDEAALCEEYGLSRTPMREIFQRLHGEGYLQLEQNRGPKVASMDLGVMRMFFQTAPVIYANVARLAAENRQLDQLPLLKEIQAEFRVAMEASDTESATFLNHRFHEQIGMMAHNPYLLVALKRMLIDHTRLSQTFYRPRSEDEAHRVAVAVAHHDGMISAIENQNPEQVVALTLDHWNLSRDRLERYVMPDPLPLDAIPAEDARYG